MRRNRAWRFGAALTIACGMIAGCGGMPDDGPLAAPAGADDVPAVADHLIVVTRGGADANSLAALYASANVTLLDRLAGISADLVHVDSSRREAARGVLAASMLVEDVADDREYDAQALPDDPLYSNQWQLAAIGAPDAWDITRGADEVVVAVLDTGVDPKHSDLAGKLLPGANTYDNTSNTQDKYGHGTSVAGVIAASTDNAKGVASVAWGTMLIPIRISSDKGRTSSWAIAAGIREAVADGARVLNISFAPLQNDSIVLRQAEAARLAGSLVVIAAGNDGSDATDPDSRAAVFVGAVDGADAVATFSTRGPFVDLTAPGVSVYTTKVGNKYGALSGTSFAAPVVSGVAALVWSVNPRFRPTTVEQILRVTSRDLGPEGRDPQYGAGRVDAAAAVRLALDVIEADDKTPPAVSIRSPTSGASIATLADVTVDASDDFDVADVTLYIDDVPVADDAVSPYRMLVDPVRFATGRHTLRAVATDTSGNVASDAISVEFAGASDGSAPAVTIKSPRDGQSIRGVVSIVADATDDRSLTSAEVQVDGKRIATIPLQSDPQATVAYNWTPSATGTSSGWHTVVVRVFDATGNSGAASVRLKVSR